MNVRLGVWSQAILLLGDSYIALTNVESHAKRTPALSCTRIKNVRLWIFQTQYAEVICSTKPLTRTITVSQYHNVLWSLESLFRIKRLYSWAWCSNKTLSPDRVSSNNCSWFPNDSTTDDHHTCSKFRCYIRTSVGDCLDSKLWLHHTPTDDCLIYTGDDYSIHQMMTTDNTKSTISNHTGNWWLRKFARPVSGHPNFDFIMTKTCCVVAKATVSVCICVMGMGSVLFSSSVSWSHIQIIIEITFMASATSKPSI